MSFQAGDKVVAKSHRYSPRGDGSDLGEGVVTYVDSEEPIYYVKITTANAGAHHHYYYSDELEAPATTPPSYTTKYTHSAALQIQPGISAKDLILGLQGIIDELGESVVLDHGSFSLGFKTP